MLLFTSIIKELLGSKIAKCNEIYSQILIIIDDEYESSNIASQKELRSIFGTELISILITLHTHLIKLSTSLSLTQKFEEYNRNNR